MQGSGSPPHKESRLSSSPAHPIACERAAQQRTPGGSWIFPSPHSLSGTLSMSSPSMTAGTCSMSPAGMTDLSLPPSYHPVEANLLPGSSGRRPPAPRPTPSRSRSGAGSCATPFPESPILTHRQTKHWQVVVQLIGGGERKHEHQLKWSKASGRREPGPETQ